VTTGAIYSSRETEVAAVAKGLKYGLAARERGGVIVVSLLPIIVQYISKSCIKYLKLVWEEDKLGVRE
jgi:hypothetical protein